MTWLDECRPLPFSLHNGYTFSAYRAHRTSAFLSVATSIHSTLWLTAERAMLVAHESSRVKSRSREGG